MVAWRTARELALSLPEAEEARHFESLAFRGGSKTFAQLPGEAKMPSRALMKLPMVEQAALILLDPQAFSPASSRGRHGWALIDLTTVEPAQLLDLFSLCWRQVAPKKLTAAHGLA